MAYFPFFVDLQGRSGLIIGGGKTALGKVRRLLDYGPKLTVIAPDVLPELEKLPGVSVIFRAFQPKDVDDRFSFVVAATNDCRLNHEISLLCQERKIPINVVDTAEDCTFLFPSLVRRGSLSIGISTAGASPSGAIYFKDRINDILPEQIGEILSWLDSQREPIRRTVDSGAVRKVIFQHLFAGALNLNRPLTPEETQTVIETAEGGRSL